MSSQDLVVSNQPQGGAPAPFGPQGRQLAAMGTANIGAVTVESDRAIAEAQGQLILAKRFPRDMTKAHADLMAACKSKAFAEKAFYAKPQGGSTVKGPSIRMAEEVARVYGNCQYGHRELSRDSKKSEIEVYFWDMENNNYNKRQITVMHVIDTREGPKPMRDQSQIDMKINNIASKQVRGLILAGVAKWLVEDAVAECAKTIAGNNEEPLESRVRKMTQAFAKFGVTTERLEKHLGHKLDQTTLDEVVDLQGMFNSLRDGTPASELFPLEDDTQADDKPSGLADTARKGAEAKAAAPAAAPAKAAAKEKPAKAQPAEAKEQPAAAETAAADPAAQEPAATAKPEVNSAQKEGKAVNAQAPEAEPQPAGQNGNATDDSDFF